MKASGPISQPGPISGTGPDPVGRDQLRSGMHARPRAHPAAGRPLNIHMDGAGFPAFAASGLQRQPMPQQGFGR